MWDALSKGYLAVKCSGEIADYIGKFDDVVNKCGKANPDWMETAKGGPECWAALLSAKSSFGTLVDCVGPENKAVAEKMATFGRKAFDWLG